MLFFNLRLFTGPGVDASQDSAWRYFEAGSFMPKKEQ
jgi:hypothetical protein